MTDKFKFNPTPGPWKNNGGQIEGPGGFPNVVCVVGKVNNQSIRDTSNARLIAKSPDLLGLVNDFCFALELKMKNYSCSDLTGYELEAYNRAVGLLAEIKK